MPTTRAGLDRGVDAHAAPGTSASSDRAGRREEAARPRRSRAPRSRGRSSSRRRRARSPAATRSCSSTRSSPVTSSVTGCSTCSRAFISRKKCVRGIVGVGDELDRARAVVARRARQRDGLRARAVAQLGRDDRRRRLLEHLLVAALQRALALAEREHVAVRVADHLHLDVPRARQEALEEHAVVAEARRRPRGCAAAIAVVELLRALDDAHPAPAAARRGLDQQRVGVRAARRLVRSATRRPARPRAAAAAFARTLSPISSIASGDGPTNTTPASAHARASAGFSDRKP